MTSDNRPEIILLVEDEALVRMLASDILTEEAGYRVIEAVNADEALTLLEARPDVRLVFTDVDMPGSLNGFTLARIVDMRWPEIGIIVTSGYPRPGAGDVPKKARFLPKPYRPSHLIKLVQDMLGEAQKPIIVAPQDAPPAEQGAPVLSLGIKVDQLHTGIGAAGGLAQPLSEPDE
jgi:CheY-like chemotaxis protein